MKHSYPTTPEFKKHSSNAAAVKKELIQIARIHRQLIREGNAPATTALARSHSMYVGVLAEAMLRKIVTDPTGFNDNERRLIWKTRSQGERWTQALELAFRRHYMVPIHHDLDAATLGSPVVHQQYKDVLHLLQRDIVPVIEARNKHAHGQWHWLLKSRQENQFHAKPAVAPPNYLVSNSQAQIVELIARLMHVLAVSEPTFMRDYSTTVAKIAEADACMKTGSYADLVAKLKSTRKVY